MIILIIIILSIKVQALNFKYQRFSNNVTPLHDTVLNGTESKSDFADASTHFKVLNKKTDDAGTLYASVQTVFDTNDIKNMIELRNQVKLYQLRENDKKSKTFC